MVNQYLYNKLSEITPNVYPDFIPMAVEFPAIMIELVETDNEIYKGGSDVTMQTWAVHIVSPTVEARNLLALEVIDKIEHKSDPAYYVDDCVLIDSSTGFDKDVEMYLNVMMFEIRVKDFAAYSLDAFDWDFEGTLTVGEFEGEGEVMEYGYRSGWGDDYGSISDFYTYYEYAGIYFIEDTLYIWGVDVAVLQIDGENYINGTYNSSGYTTFPFTTNPLDGATAAIKIKGTNMETWDYEGVMTSGDPYIYYGTTYYGCFYEVAILEDNHLDLIKHGNLEPDYIGGSIYSTGALIGLQGIVRYLKIENTIYTSPNYHTGVGARSEFTYIGNPFAPTGGNFNVKIKLW